MKINEGNCNFPCLLEGISTLWERYMKISGDFLVGFHCEFRARNRLLTFYHFHLPKNSILKPTNSNLKGMLNNSV